jgi:aryl-alcohol dehydrogenase-like predicted oxidoreductase
LLQRYPETNGVLEACRELKVSLIACIPLALGILTGKYRKGETHLTLFQKMFYRMGELDFFKERQDPKPWLQRIFAKPHALQFGKLEPMFRAMEEIGQAHGKSIVQVGLNWLMAGDEWVIPIPGAKSVQQAQGNAGALGWRLSPEEHERISRAEAAARHGVQ